MTRKLMTSAFALTAVLAFSALPAASALANPWSGGPDIDDSYNDNSKTDVDVDVDVDDSFNDNSHYDSDVDVDVKDSLNDNSLHDSKNDNRDYDDSFNDNSKVEDSNNDNSKVEDSNNDNREYKSEIDDSFNDNSKIEDSYNSDSSTNDSNNDNSDHSSWRISLTLQDLDANVSGFEFDVGGGHKAGELKTGDISNSGGAFAGFAGIQTANYNTGFAANNQAATAISANANVTFGNGGGGN